MHKLNRIVSTDFMQPDMHNAGRGLGTAGKAVNLGG